jgi:hypothetical protein
MRRPDKLTDNDRERLDAVCSRPSILTAAVELARWL